MSGFRKGPFTLMWGGNEITNVEEISVDVSQDTDDHSTLDGYKYVFDGPITATVTLKLLRADLPTLALVLPQYFVPNGGTLSTGQQVNNAEGAVDIKAASCDTANLYHDLDVISCSQPGQVMRLVNARTKIDSSDFDNYIGTVSVQFIGEPAPGDGNIQFFTEGTIAVVS